MDEETLRETMVRLLELYAGDGSASHYLSGAFEEVPYSFRPRIIGNVTNALDIALVSWQRAGGYAAVEHCQGATSLHHLRRGTAAGVTVATALEAFVWHQLAQHQEEGAPYADAAADVRQQWREFADNDALFLPFLSRAEQQRRAARNEMM